MEETMETQYRIKYGANYGAQYEIKYAINYGAQYRIKYGTNYGEQYGIEYGIKSSTDDTILARSRFIFTLI